MADLGSLMASTERRKEGSGSAKISENLDRRANSRIQRNRGKTRLSKERRSAVKISFQLRLVLLEDSGSAKFFPKNLDRRANPRSQRDGNKTKLAFGRKA